MTRALLAVCLLALLGLGMVAEVQAQSAPLTDVNARTEVRSISFRFISTQTFSPSRLKEHIAHSEQGALVGLRRTLAILPLISPVGAHPFTPVELARDRIRLERFYARNGFLFADVDWLVRLDADRNVVSILFTVNEGPPLLLESLDYRGPDGRRAREHMAPELIPAWEAFRRRADLQVGVRLDDFGVVQLEERALSWVRDRGYAFAEVDAVAAVDTFANRARVVVNIDPGPRAIIDEIQVEGNESVPDRVVRRELPFREGDLFSQRRLVEGQREVFGLNIFSIALADVPPQEPDTTVSVRIRVRERDIRSLTATAGYLTEAGLTGELEWMHRNFLGDARTFTATGLANTGWLSFIDNPDRRYRTTLSVRQPYFFDRRVSLTGRVFGEMRDDFRDRSRAYGGEATLLFERGLHRNLSATYRVEDRRVQEFRFGTGGDDTQVSFIEEQLNLAVTRASNLSRSVLTLNATYGQVDDPVSPRRGFIVRPAAELAVPFPVGALRYTRLSTVGSGYLPLGDRLTVITRLGGGRLFPAVEDPQDPGEAFSELLRLRDVVFLAGGTYDVRGWAPGSVGPKVLDLITDVSADEPTLQARRYFPFGGTMRITGTAEARYALTDVIGAFGFLDVGRVWTPQQAFQVPEGSPVFDSAFGNVERFFFGTGAGISVSSPVGPIQVSLGYKVNPSFFDVRDPNAIAEAFQEVIRERPDTWTPEDLRQAALGVEPTFWRRIHLHLAIGQTF